MARWQPGARERLQQAALDLFSEQGFDRTTVGQIAERAGLTTRTFFRYFTDKREVLFVGDQQVPPMAAAVIAEAPPELSPMQVIETAVGDLGSLFDQDPQYLRQRRAVVAADPSLRERDLRKLADVSDAAAEAFRRRGLGEVEAALAAELLVTVVRVSIGRWLDDVARFRTDPTAADDPSPDSSTPDASTPDRDELPAIALDTLRRLRQLSQ